MFSGQNSLVRLTLCRNNFSFGVLLLLLSACGGSGGGIETTQKGDQIPPAVANATPANGSTGVSINSSITVEFSEEINPITITTSSFTLVGAASIPGSVSVAVDQLSATFTPDTELAYSTDYTAIITTSVTDSTGNALEENFVWQFSTESPPDTTAPTVVSTIPADTATAIAINSTISVVFSEAVDPATVDAASLTLMGSALVTGTVEVAADNLSATFTPNANLGYSTTYTATVTTAVTDTSSNPLSQDKVWSFTTGNAPDTTAPTVTSTSPTDSATGVALDANLTVVFSEAINPTTIDSNSFILQAGAPITGSVSVAADNLSATFTPNVNFAFDTVYTATITTAVTDLSGNPLSQNKVWQFTSVPDTIRPTVTSTTPPNSSANVALDSAVTVVFSEPVASASVTTSSFTLQGGGVVAGTVVVAGDNLSATFTPSASLAYDTVYTATVTTAVTDTSGNPLSQNMVWQFTTVADTNPPTVSSTIPVDGATNVPLDSAVTVVFSEPVASASVTTSSFTLQGGGVVAGTVVVAGDDLSATFTPSASLAYDTVYTATVTTVVTDTSGNPLSQNATWQFTTVADITQVKLYDLTFELPEHNIGQPPVYGFGQKYVTDYFSIGSVYEQYSPFITQGLQSRVLTFQSQLNASGTATIEDTMALAMALEADNYWFSWDMQINQMSQLSNYEVNFDWFYSNNKLAFDIDGNVTFNDQFVNTVNFGEMFTVEVRVDLVGKVADVIIAGQPVTGIPLDTATTNLGSIQFYMLAQDLSDSYIIDNLKINAKFKSNPSLTPPDANGDYIINFDGVPLDSGSGDAAPFSQNNFNITYVLLRDAGNGTFPTNGTNSVGIHATARPIIYHKMGYSFSLRSVDVGDYSSVAPLSSAITIEGYKRNGTVLTYTIDPAVVSMDFVTLNFGAEWVDLDYVLFNGSIFALDNIVLKISNETSQFEPVI